MKATVSPGQQIDRALHAGSPSTALRIADSLIVQSKRSHLGWLGRARATYAMGMMGECEVAVDEVLKGAPRDPQALLLKGLVYQRFCQVDQSVATLSMVVSSGTPYANEASIALAETLFFAHRRDELRRLIASGGPWLNDQRGALLRARITAWSDPQRAIEELTAISVGASGGDRVVLRRVAGFEAVKHLDQAGRYREAFTLATEIHRETTLPFDVEGLVGAIQETAALLARKGRWFSSRADPVDGVAMIAGLPRSGTTLIEQMLDAHPAISGIGEYDGVRRLAAGFASTGVPLSGLGSLDRDTAMALQRGYCDGAHRLARPGASWTFDKTLGSWRALPEIAAILPGARLLNVARDPRDNAISAYLSFFHPVSYGWMGSLGSIRRVIEAERMVLPSALETLGIPHVAVVYERLVEDPARYASECLACLGLEMVPAVLAPEHNTRAVFTLSHDQVKKPINKGSIGRWKNYEWAFDSGWDAAAAAHAARPL